MKFFQQYVIINVIVFYHDITDMRRITMNDYMNDNNNADNEAKKRALDEPFTGFD